MEKVRAKVICTGLIPDEYAQSTIVGFSAVYSDDPNSENKAFSDATPSLQMQMSISNGRPALDYFKPGEHYYLDFIKAD